MNGDGQADYGSCIFKKRNAQSYFAAIQTVAAPYRADPGHGPGLPLRRRDDEADGQQRSLEEGLRALQGNRQVSVRRKSSTWTSATPARLFKAGRCGLLIEWGDPGTLQLDPDAGAAIKGMIFAVSAVGSKEVLDRATGKLVPVTKENAPHAVDGINYAPFAAFGGWAGGINAKADQKKKDAPMPSSPT